MRLSTRRARKLREEIMIQRQRQLRFIDFPLETQKRWANEQVADLRRKLSPEYHLRLSKGLAYWEAAVDSLEDDGVMPDPKGSE